MMKHTFLRLLFLLVLLVSVSSCGTTIYRAKYLKSNKYIKEKKRYHFWHAHGNRPHKHAGGYW